MKKCKCRLTTLNPLQFPLQPSEMNDPYYWFVVKKGDGLLFEVPESAGPEAVDAASLPWHGCV